MEGTSCRTVTITPAAKLRHNGVLRYYKKKKGIWGSQEREGLRGECGYMRREKREKDPRGTRREAGSSKLGAEVMEQQRRGDGGVFGAETRQERLRTAARPDQA